MPRLLRRALLRDAGVLLAASMAFMLTMGAVTPAEDRAVGNAQAIQAMERQVGLDIEPGIQRVVGAVPASAPFMQAYYLVSNSAFLVVGLVLVALRRPTAWGAARDVVLIVTVAGLLLHVLYPLAPPRLTPGSGLADTLADGGTDGLRQGVFNRWANPYAAFPSMHMATAIVSATLVSAALAGNRAAAWAWLHPTCMALTVMATGNHWVVDIVGAAAIAVPTLALRWPHRAPSTIAAPEGAAG